MMGLDRVRMRWADVDLGGGMTLELVQFLHPAGSPVSKSLWDPGATHIGLQVDDIDAMHARLREAEVRVVSKPVRLTEEGSWYGAKVLYAVDPDGTWIELVERPEPVAVLHETDDQEIRVDVHERAVGRTWRPTGRPAPRTQRNRNRRSIRPASAHGSGRLAGLAA